MAKGTPTERFWHYVDKTDGCWLWTGGNNGVGYGRFFVGGKKVYAHRFAYESLVGPIPEGLHIDHLCRTPACVRPDHLDPVTHAENVRRGRGGAYWAAKTHCPSGHPYSGDNLVIHKSGGRVCRTCRTAAQARWYKRQKGELDESH